MPVSVNEFVCGYLFRPALFIIIMATVTACAVAQAVSPVLSTDLRKFGYLVPTAERDLRALDFLHNAVTFLDNDALVVSYFVRNEQPGLANRAGTPTSPVLFHSVVLSVSKKKVTVEKSWGSAGYWNAVLALDDGRLFVQANEWVSIHSRDLNQLARRRLVYPSDILPRFAVSPTRRTLYGFQDWTPPGKSWTTRIAVIDPRTLEIRRSETTPLHAAEAVSDLQVVFTENPNHMRFASYELDPLALKMPPPNSDDGKLVAESGCNSMAFASNTILAISGNCSQFILLDQSGLVSYARGSTLHFANRKIGGDFEASQDGSRLAFAVSSKQKDNFVIRVLVYDFRTKRIAFSTGLPREPVQKFELALSPDGSRLAVLTDYFVHVWSVP